jgi:hypothetical protein
MSNIEENQPAEENNPAKGQSAKQQDSTGNSNKPEDSSQETTAGNADSEQTNGVDPSHNTGNKHMRIDEEGGEIGPDDQI